MSNAIVYLRTSTKDQNPQLQEKDCYQFCTEQDLAVVEVVSEQGSAYRLEKKRPKWEYVVNKAKDEGLHIVVWRYDRCFRNREEFYKFMMVMFEVYKRKVYSVKEPSILSLWGMLDNSSINDPVMGELMNNLLKSLWKFLIQNAGEQAEEESKKKSQRIKLAVRKGGGTTKSYKGNKWGRKELKSTRKKVIELYNQGKKMREIREEVHYWKGGHKKNVSLGLVHKIVTEYKEGLSTTKGSVQHLNKK